MTIRMLRIGIDSGKNLHDCMLSLTGEVYPDRINLTPPHFTEMSVSVR